MQKYFAFLTLIIFPVSVFAFTVPQKPTGFIQDYVGVLTRDQVLDLETKLENYEKNTTNEIVVVIIKSLDGDTIENVAQDIFTKWGIGKKGVDNGVLLLVSIEDRKTRIHTGYGVEGFLTDIGTSYIQSDIIAPAFRKGDYYGGISLAVGNMVESLSGADIVPRDYSGNKSKVPWDFVFIVFIFFIQILAAVLARSRSWWGGGVLGGVFGLAIWHFFIASIVIAVPVLVVLVLFGLFFDYLVSKSYNESRLTGVYPWWMRGGGGGSGGGGFGGFGGGGSGGGGSSGSW